MSEQGKMFYQTNPTTFWIISLSIVAIIVALGLSIANTATLSEKLNQNKQKLDETKVIIRTQDFGIQTYDYDKLDSKKIVNTYDWSFTSGCKDGSLDGGNTPFDASSFFCIKVITTDKDGKKIDKNILCMDPANPGDFTKKITCKPPATTTV
jgi:hypothetical protein